MHISCKIAAKSNKTVVQSRGAPTKSVKTSATSTKPSVLNPVGSVGCVFVVSNMTNLYVTHVRSSIPPRWDKCAQNDLSPTKNGTVSLFYLRTFHKRYALVPHNIAALPRHKAATWRYLIKKYINKSKPHTKRASAYSIQQRQRKQAWQPKKCVFHNRVFFIFNWSLKIWIWKKKTTIYFLRNIFVF